MFGLLGEIVEAIEGKDDSCCEEGNYTREANQFSYQVDHVGGK
jgi:hypothetical protein